jgi:type III secretion protein L
VGLVFLIDRPGYRLATDRKVLKRNEAVVIEEITRAYVRAQGEINSALANLDKACAKATDDAYRKGLAKAELEAAQKWTLAEVERLVLLKSMQPALAEIIVDAVSLLAQDIDRQAFLLRAIEVLQGSLRTVNSARLRVHPELVPMAEVALSEFEARTGLGRLARVVADETLARDACLLESESGTVDASLATQLQAISNAVTEAVRLMTPAGAS